MVQLWSRDTLKFRGNETCVVRCVGARKRGRDRGRKGRRAFCGKPSEWAQKAESVGDLPRVDAAIKEEDLSGMSAGKGGEVYI